MPLERPREKKEARRACKLPHHWHRHGDHDSRACKQTSLEDEAFFRISLKIRDAKFRASTGVELAESTRGFAALWSGHVSADVDASEQKVFGDKRLSLSLSLPLQFALPLVHSACPAREARREGAAIPSQGQSEGACSCDSVLLRLTCSRQGFESKRRSLACVGNQSAPPCWLGACSVTRGSALR